MTAPSTRLQGIIDHANGIAEAHHGWRDRRRNVAIAYLAGFDDGMRFDREHPAAAAAVSAEIAADIPAQHDYRAGRDRWLQAVAQDPASAVEFDS